MLLSCLSEFSAVKYDGDICSELNGYRKQMWKPFIVHVRLHYGSHLRIPDWGFKAMRCLGAIKPRVCHMGECNKEESNSCIQEGNGTSPCEHNWQTIALIKHKDFHWNHGACLGYTAFHFTSHIHLTTGTGLFPCQQAGVKALLITILPAKKWILPSIYSGSEKLFAFRRDYKMESFYSWHLQSQLLLLGQLKIHALCL